MEDLGQPSEEEPAQIPEEDENISEDLGQPSGEGPARDLALRFSSRVHNLCLGFTFGRNYRLCDLLLGDINNKKFSNRHFRIFIQSNGSLMLEDTSTNGTIVDGTVLRGAKSNAPVGLRQPMHTLHHGFIIELPTISSKNEETLRFVVRIPPRDDYEDRYKQNLGTYLACIAQAERQQAVMRHAAAKGQTITVPAVSHNIIPLAAVQMQGVNEPTGPDDDCSMACSPRQNNAQWFYPNCRHLGQQPWPQLERWRKIQRCQLSRQRCFCYGVQAFFKAEWRAVCRERDLEEEIHQGWHSRPQVSQRTKRDEEPPSRK